MISHDYYIIIGAFEQGLSIFGKPIRNMIYVHGG